MSKDRYERRHRRTAGNCEAVSAMTAADFNAVPSLAAAMGLRRCVHGSVFPCLQCLANRRWNELATDRRLTETEFEAKYVVAIRS